MPRGARVYVMGGYVPHGGTRMAYEIGLVGYQELGLDIRVVTVGGERADSGIFTYPVPFSTVGRDAFFDEVEPQDLLICNPSFSDGSIGLRVQARKLMYIQGFNSYTTLDGWFDSYTAVSSFVRDHVRAVYGREVPVIPPFIDQPPFAPPPWNARPEASIYFHLKGPPEQQALLFERLRVEVEALSPRLAATIDWTAPMAKGDVPNAEFRARLGRSRYFVTLSVAEGFGLVPLEAMAAGCTVIGFDGFGGRDYMHAHINCAVRSYPDIAGVAADLVELMEQPERAARLAEAGLGTAAVYSHARFRGAWLPVLRQVMGEPPVEGRRSARGKRATMVR